MVKETRSVTEYPVSLRFPLEEEHRRLWIVNMGKDAEWTPSESSSLCSAHFTPDCFESGSACLHSDAIPTVFNFTQTEVSLYLYRFIRALSILSIQNLLQKGFNKESSLQLHFKMLKLLVCVSESDSKRH